MNCPEPANDDRVKTNARFFRIVFKALIKTRHSIESILLLLRLTHSMLWLRNTQTYYEDCNDWRETVEQMDREIWNLNFHREHLEKEDEESIEMRNGITWNKGRIIEIVCCTTIKRSINKIRWFIHILFMNRRDND